MPDSLYYSCHHFDQVNHVQSWSEPALNNLVYADNYKDLLSCHNKIILLQPRQANGDFHITEQLIKQKNYLLFVLYTDGHCEAHYHSLKNDLPIIRKFACIVDNVSDQWPNIQVSPNWFFFRTMSNYNMLRAQLYTTDQIYATKNKPFKFLYLNGAARLHRQKLWQSIENANLLDSSLNSFLGYGNFNNTIPVKHLPTEYDSYHTNIKTTLTPGVNVDYETFKFSIWNRHWVDGDIIPSQYTDTYFSLVAETEITPGGSLTTEKTYKPILAGHPFIILGNPGFYKNLQRLGFQTFNNIIDESFDEEENEDRRIEMITREVQKLCSQDLDKFLEQTKEICLYNQQHYISSQTKMFKQMHFDLLDFFTKVEADALKYFNT